MLNGLSREDIRILKTKLKTVRRNFQYARARIARVTKNPRLLRVTFHTFRHWKATMEYHKAKDILHVMRMLGHRNINNTLRYTQLIRTEDDEFVSKVAKTVEEACAEPMICHGLRKNPLLPLNKAKLIHKIKKRV